MIWINNLINCFHYLFELIFKASFIIAFVWHIYGILQLKQKEKEIYCKENEIENSDIGTMKKNRGFDVNQSQLEKIQEKNRRPIEKELIRLREKRQFFLDKFPLLGFLKR